MANILTTSITFVDPSGDIYRRLEECRLPIDHNGYQGFDFSRFIGEPFSHGWFSICLERDQAGVVTVELYTTWSPEAFCRQLSRHAELTCTMSMEDDCEYDVAVLRDGEIVSIETITVDDDADAP